jgi:addiction module HigA family antidote
LSADAWARALGVTTARINEIVRERRGITGDTALRLEHYFGTDAQSWLNLQAAYELHLAEFEPVIGTLLPNIPLTQAARQQPLPPGAHGPPALRGSVDRGGMDPELVGDRGGCIATDLQGEIRDAFPWTGGRCAPTSLLKGPRVTPGCRTPRGDERRHGAPPSPHRLGRLEGLTDGFHER